MHQSLRLYCLFIHYRHNELRPYLMKGIRTHGKICYSQRIIRQAGVGVGARCQYGKRALLQHRRLRRNGSRLGCRLLCALPRVAGLRDLGLCLDGYTHRSSLLLPGLDLLQPYLRHAAQRR